MVTTLVRDGEIVATTIHPIGPLDILSIGFNHPLGSMMAASSADDSDAENTRTH